MTEPYYSDDSVTLYHGDALAVLASLDSGSVDAVVTDPPYGLEFMGKEWDAPWAKRVGLGGNTAGLGEVEMADGATRLARPNYYGSPNPTCRNCGGLKRGSDTKRSQKACRCDAPRFDDVIGPRMRAYQAWCEQWAAECLRLLKPGGHLLAFGGTRTHHRLACAIEDAGFEIRDSIAWLYGQGFPKSLNVAKAIASGGRPEDIRRLAMGEDYEPSGRGRVNYDHGSGSAMNGSSDDMELTEDARRWQGWGTALKPAHEPIVVARKPLAGTVAGNVLEHGTGALNIDGCRVGDTVETWPASRRYKATGFEPGGSVDGETTKTGDAPAGRWPANVALDETQAAELDRQSGTSASRIGKPRGAANGDGWGMTATGSEYGDIGGASRFFPVFRYEPKAATHERPHVDGTAHPTVKPLDLMRWLVRLITPPGGLVLDPFAGSGTTGEACLIEGFQCVLIEDYEDYLPLIRARLDKPIQPVLGGAT